jgi:hypothetical protein
VKGEKEAAKDENGADRPHVRTKRSDQSKKWKIDRFLFPPFSVIVRRRRLDVGQPTNQRTTFFI